MTMLKDERLARLADRYNVAQFASFAQDGSLRFEVMHSPPMRRPPYSSVRDVVADLFARVPSLNIRTFADAASKNTDFVYGVTNVDDVVALVNRFSGRGLYTIVNETIDVHDGGVSGVSMGGVTEFAPDATPRIVEDVNNVVARLPSKTAAQILQTVYGFRPRIPESRALRVEFSVHPLRVGHRGEHSLCWEVAHVERTKLKIRPSWPNRFSELVGDKVFGLLLADAGGLPVPVTTVVSRRIAPFRFGTSTKTRETWLRTSPKVPQAGRFTTHRGWSDPFELFASEDSKRELASVLAQEGIDAQFAGGAASQVGGPPIIEGTPGYGDRFMLGGRSSPVPERVRRSVHHLVKSAAEIVGPVQIEWVHDGKRPWIVQLHARMIDSLSPGVLNPGHADRWIQFDPAAGLDRLRETVEEAAKRGAGIEVTQAVGVTSHVGDVIRKAGVPGRLSASPLANSS